MNYKGLLILGVFFLFAAAFLTAEEEAPKGIVTQVTGVVRLVGSGPMTQLVITGDRVQWYISNDDRSKLFDLQQQVVTVEGEEIVTQMTFASGRPAGTRRELKNITIISVGE